MECMNLITTVSCLTALECDACQELNGNFFVSDDDQDELDSDEEEYYGNRNVDTSRVDEIPAKEPKFNAVSSDIPSKS
jgi:hypothetical protein